MTGNGAGSLVVHGNDAVHHSRPPADTPDTDTAAPPDAVADPTPPRRQRRLTRQETRHPHAPTGGRTVAWLGFGFGAVLSVMANWLYTWLPADTQPDGWSPGIAPQIGSAVWPIVLMLSVEVLLRVRWLPGLWWKLARYAGAGTVALGSAIISYGHVYHVLLSWGYDSVGARVGPLAIDGFMVICGFALLSESTPAQPDPDPADTAGDTRDTTSAVVDTPPDTRDSVPDAVGITGDTTADAKATVGDKSADSDRDNSIRAMYRTVRSTRIVADAFGLHHSTVAKIVAQPDSTDTTPGETNSGDTTEPGQAMAGSNSLHH
ncbi:hypothetical protein FOH10_29530 [Nocardia otitidiscaviarum]|uniref:DUF2637 domain-containing protein n=1 Tax=Nocardia otitidiscaviarum TaxID=1823 RepID=A0A516NTR9_9NOCA|nr:hypothetical protein [Nocardia otitidiscaviarum]MCP9621595.1 hypothetical protein [Nocardia otitidiscaviarum]QDP82261.1 hypothetical protein FOH10_29530 [Nocardia otitidiscaviarum]